MGSDQRSPNDSQAMSTNHRRWYDSAKIIWALLGMISMMIVAWGGFVFSTANGASIKNVEQDGVIREVRNTMDGIERRQERMADKVDKILERVERRNP